MILNCTKSPVHILEFLLPGTRFLQLIHLSSTLPSGLSSSIICHWLSGSLSYLLPHYVTLLSLWTCLLHCTLKSSCLPFQVNTDHLVSDYLVCLLAETEFFLLQCFSSTYSEDSFFCIILSSACCGGISVLRELWRRSRKINLLLYFPGAYHMMWLLSSRKLPRHCTAGRLQRPTAWSGGRDENWSRGRPSPLVPWAQASNCRVFSLVIPLTLPKNLPSACGCH